ncbi:MAG: hypothetical protein ACI318_05780 [Bacilli bacterium]
MLKKETPIKIENNSFYKNDIPYNIELEEEWLAYKKIIDQMLSDGIIEREQWLFCVKRIREKLGLINVD